MLYIAILLSTLLVIFMASQLFTNALEHWGHQAGISAGAAGSILAAVATALPETIVPIIALVAGTSHPSTNQAISTGAILGAPFMLSTLSIFLMALFAGRKRGIRGHINPERTGFIRDLHFFIFAFILAIAAMYFPMQPHYWRTSISLTLVALYIIYVVQTFNASSHLVNHGHGVMADEPLLFSRLLNSCKLRLNDKIAIRLQLLSGLLLLLFAAKGFIYGVENLSSLFHVSTLLLALFITPLATELPEKINSIIWIQKKKDTLAVGNITGAMVFQGALLPALGVHLTTWQPHEELLLVMCSTLVAAIWLRYSISQKEGLSIAAILINGLLYFLVIALLAAL